MFANADAYARHVAEYVLGEITPEPPSTPEEMLVITEEYPYLLADFWPLLLEDTSCRRAAVELLTEVPDWY